MKRKTLAVVMFILITTCVLSGCGKDAQVTAPDTKTVIVENNVETYEAESEDNNITDISSMGAPEELVGCWYTDGYDTDNNWASSYVIELFDDGTASCNGWRNSDYGYFDIMGTNKVLITFNDCMINDPETGMSKVDDYEYTIELEYTGDNGTIRVNDPEVINNIEDGKVQKGDISGNIGSDQTVEKTTTTVTTTVTENTVSDGIYFTDEDYDGSISMDDGVLVIETALYHYDNDWDKVVDYQKSRYEFPMSEDCKCTIMQEDVNQYPVSEKIGFISEFLSGNSGLPITLVIKNGELVEIQFTS